MKWFTGNRKEGACTKESRYLLINHGNWHTTYDLNKVNDIETLKDIIWSLYQRSCEHWDNTHVFVGNDGGYKSTLWRPVHITVSEAIKTILDHLGLEFDHEPQKNIPEKFCLKKKDKEEEVKK